ncbi:DNA/RNA non-specific endonuclease [Herbiconiux sp. CPCC 205716]|uniref:DNA/RNA non-specific endonuclease n=1 Tax=Herbiconiux gentiana TaxID=2970912 RepID=A0ABT2GGV3_9MICO|nr:DNA/RNA non-specific endonuclease [Herbiconiux gentiana]MCS5715447.1 DNA/RNA non-specific endonuclease [Herbiconiux gentiana]
MSGYDPEFLQLDDDGDDGDSRRALPIPAPRGQAQAARIRTLDYTHFTVLLDAGRRLAAATAVNIDGAALLDLGRGDDWHLDDRVPADEQAGPELYARNDLDRGHLVRRRDPVWGDVEIASEANFDSFCYTNAAPQAAVFNQSIELWNGLEDLVLQYASANRLRLSVFTGPVFADDDEPYRGVRIPTQFWKVAAWASGGRLQASGYLLDQSPQLGGIDLEQTATDAPPPLGPFRTFQLPVADLDELTGLDFKPLVASDVLASTVPTAGVHRERWIELTAPEHLRW